MMLRGLSLCISAAALAVVGWCVLKIEEPLSARDKASVVAGLAQAMRDRYVFPELGTKAAEDIESKLKSGDFDKAESGPAFAKALTDSLNAICKDAHLRVRHSSTAYPERKHAAQPSTEEIKRQARFERLGNAGYMKLERLDGNVGYLEVTHFSEPDFAEKPCQAAFDFLANTDALIIDVRRNGGGSPKGVQLLCSYLFGAKPVHLNDLYFREGNRTVEFWTLKKVAGKRYVDRPVWVLCSKRTGSGAEEFCYNLQNLKRADIVGEVTWGGANPGGIVRLSDHFAAFVPTGRAINPYTKDNWEGKGVKPDTECPTGDALAIAHKKAVQSLLSKATDPDDKARLEDVLKSLGN